MSKVEKSTSVAISGIFAEFDSNAHADVERLTKQIKMTLGLVANCEALVSLTLLECKEGAAITPYSVSKLATREDRNLHVVHIRRPGPENSKDVEVLSLDDGGPVVLGPFRHNLNRNDKKRFLSCGNRLQCTWVEKIIAVSGDDGQGPEILVVPGDYRSILCFCETHSPQEAKSVIAKMRTHADKNVVASFRASFFDFHAIAPVGRIIVQG